MRIPSYRTTKRLALALGVGVAGCQSLPSETDGELGAVAEAEHAVANDPLPNTRFDVVDLGDGDPMYLLVTNGTAFRLNCPAGDARDNMVAGAGFDPNQVRGQMPFLPTATEIVDLASVGVPGGVASPTRDSFRALPCNNPSQATFNVIDFSAAQDGSDKRYFVSLNVVDLVSSTSGPEKDAAGHFILRNVGCGELLLAMGYPLRDAIPVDHRQVYQPPPAMSNGIYVTSDPYDISCHTGHTPATFIPSITPSVDPAQPLIKKAGDTWQVVFTPFALPADAKLVLTTNGCGFAQPQNLSLSKWTVTGAIPSPFTNACSLTFIGQSGTINTPPVSIQFAPPPLPPPPPRRPDEILLVGGRDWSSIPIASSSYTSSNPVMSFAVTNGPVGGAFGESASAYGAEKLAGDFDGDGRSDVALAGTVGALTLPVALALDGGNWNVVTNSNSAINDFAAKASAAGARRLVGDFDGDGKSDIVLTGSTRADGLPIAFSSGAGNWRVVNGDAVAAFAALSATARIRFTGDFNKDGKTDIALAPQKSWSDPTLMPIAFSKGDGTWTVTMSTVGAFGGLIDAPGAELLTGDFNNDGRTDVALTGPGDWTSIPVAFANGDGSWTVASTPLDPDTKNFASWSSSLNVSRLVGDFDNDGRADIALTGPNWWTTLPVAFSKGDGTWRITNSGASTFAAQSNSAAVTHVIGDFNRDGKSDIALTGNASWDKIPVALSNGDGTFTTSDWPLTNVAFASWSNTANIGNAAKLVGYTSGAPHGGTVQAQPRPIRRALDGDEVVMVGRYSSGGPIPVAVMNGDGTWAVTAAGTGAKLPDQSDFGSRAAADSGDPVYGDYDGDGRTDIALAGDNGAPQWTTAPIAFGAGGGTWRVTSGEAAGFVLTSANDGFHLGGDFDGDGKSDMTTMGVYQNYDSPVPAPAPIAFSNGDGTWRTPDAVNVPAELQTPTPHLIGDFNGDGKTDIAVLAPWWGGQTHLWTGIPVAFSNGDGTWTSTSFLGGGCQDFPAWATTVDVNALTGDFNGDGKTDIALTGPKGWSTVPIAFSNGDGRWTCTNGWVGNFAPNANGSDKTRFVGDFDGDGYSDIAIWHRGATSIPIAFGNRDGSWRVVDQPTAMPTYVQSDAFAGAFAGDFDHDGRTDIVLEAQMGPMLNGFRAATLTTAFSNGTGGWNMSPNRDIDSRLAPWVYSTWKHAVGSARWGGVPKAF